MIIPQNFGDRIKSLRRKNNLKQNELAKLLTVTNQYIFKLENGKIKNPSYHLIEIISKVLDTSPEFLINGTEHHPLAREINSDNIFRLAPVLKWNEIGDWVNYGETALKERVVERERIEKDCPKECFILNVENDTMCAASCGRNSFYEGDLIIVNPKREAVSGDFIICSIPSHNTPILRQLMIDGGQKWLKCLNKKYSMQIVKDENFKIYGVVVSKLTKF